MPYRKKVTFKSKRKPRYTKKFYKAFPKMINGNNQTYRFKLQGLYSIANSGGAAADIACSVFLNTPGFVWDNTATRVQINEGLQYARLLSVYDRYRVNALKVSFLPGYDPNATSENTLFAVNDYDDYALLTQAKAMSAGATIYSRVLGANARKITKVFRNPDKKYLNLALAQQSPSSTVTATTILPVDFFKSMKLVFGQIPAALTVGQICCEWDISFKGINQNNT